MDFIVRSLALAASTGTGRLTINPTASVKYGNSTQAALTPTSFTLGAAANTGNGRPAVNQTASVDYGNSTQAAPPPTSYTLGSAASTGNGRPTVNQTASARYGNSTQSTPTPTSFTVGTASHFQTSRQFGNATQTVTAFNSGSILNVTRTPDLNNATECIMEYWAESRRWGSWYNAQHTTYIINATKRYLVKTAVPPEPLGNISYTRLCDGLPRFTDPSDEAKVMVTLPTPITRTVVQSQLIIESTGTEESPDINYPDCSVKAPEECTNLWSLHASLRLSTLGDWSSTDVLTISVPPSPTSIMVNGKVTPLPAAPGVLPALPIHGNVYPAGADGIWSIHDAYNFVGETFIAPGQQVTFTWNYGDRPTQIFPYVENCPRPTGREVGSDCRTAVACTITAKSVELFFFPPPSTSRDLCANTSPGFNKYTQSIYLQPHRSVVINSTTFWMDKAYVKYNTVSAYKRCQADHGMAALSTSVGGTYTDALVEVESRDLSTICGWQLNQGRPLTIIGATPVPINFDDFNGPVPESAYQCLMECGWRGSCSSIVQTLHNPNLAVPPQVRALDPEWESCVPFFEGTHDPPIALSSASDFLATTANSMQSPTPGISASAGQPTPTSRSGASSELTTSDPSDPSDLPGPSDQPRPSTPRPSQTPGSLPPLLTTSFTNTIPLPTAQPLPNEPPDSAETDSPITTIGNQPIFNTPSQPGSPNSQITIIGNPPIFTAPSQLGNTNTPIATIGNQPIFTAPSQPGAIIVGTPNSPTATTLQPGDAPIVVSGTTLSISPSATSLTISGPSILNPITTINGEPVYIDPARPDRVIIGDPSNPASQQTHIINNDGIMVISGTTLSIGSAAATATAAAAAQTAQTIPQTLTISGIPVTVLPDGSLSISVNGVTQTLQPGAPQISIDGHTIFLSPTGDVVIDGQPHRLDKNTSTPDSIVIIGPNGSRTTVSMSQATATQDPVRDLVAAIAAAAQMSTTSAVSEGTKTTKKTGSSSSSRGSSRSSTGTAADSNGPSRAVTPTTTSRGGATSWGVGIREILYTSVGMLIVLLAIC